MDWKEFLKKYGIFIVLGLVVVYFIFRKSGTPGVAPRPAASPPTASVSRPFSPTPAPRTAAATAAPVVRRPATGGGAGGATQFLGLLIGAFRSFTDLVGKLQTGPFSTPPTFPKGGRVPPRGGATSSDGLIRTIDVSGVETVIAPGGYDIPPDFGQPQSTFFPDVQGDATPGISRGGGSGSPDTGNISDLFGASGNLFGWLTGGNDDRTPNTESEQPILTDEEGNPV